nr:MAG: hypothetical protein [Sanya fiers-like virus 11]
MAQRANITLTDAATTPVNHVFKPTTSDKDVIYYKDQTVTTVPLGQAALSIQQRVPTAQFKSYKFSWKLETPTLEQTSPSTSTGIQPQPTLAYKNLVAIDLVFAERSSLQERKDILAMARDLISEAIVQAEADSLEQIW